MVKINCQGVIVGNVRAELVYSNDPISFVGGVTIQTGDVADYRHGNYGQNIAGKIFAFPFGKGSSGAGLVLMEMLRIGTAPAALINIRTDPVILTGPLICKHFYKQILPVINVTEEAYAELSAGKELELFADKNYLHMYT